MLPTLACPRSGRTRLSIVGFHADAGVAEFAYPVPNLPNPSDAPPPSNPRPTPREYARLLGFPDDFVRPIPVAAAYVLLRKTVAVLVQAMGIGWLGVKV